MARVDEGRKNSELRSIKITPNYIKYPEGSVLIELGDTKVICNATVEEKVPAFKKNSSEGFVTAEYNMLPRATHERNQRDINKLKQNKRSVEIQRLIGRSLRSVIDLKKLGERTITVDCDVIQADGGTRTASISGAYVAIGLALKNLMLRGDIDEMPLRSYLGAISVGIVSDEALLDLCYEEDKIATVDMNVVMNDQGEFIEIQGTGEERPFKRQELERLLGLAEIGIQAIIAVQKDVLGDIYA